MVTDPIADMLTRIKNAYLARKAVVVLPHSKAKEALAKVLVADLYVESYEVVDKKPQSELVLTLRYVGKRPALTGVRRVSKPGRRTYTPAKQIQRTLGGYGSTIVSTSSGIMNDKQARTQNVGGEVMCQVW